MNQRREISGRGQGEAGRGRQDLAIAPRQGNALGASSGESHRVTVVQGRWKTVVGVLHPRLWNASTSCQMRISSCWRLQPVSSLRRASITPIVASASAARLRCLLTACHCGFQRRRAKSISASSTSAHTGSLRSRELQAPSWMIGRLSPSIAKGPGWLQTCARVSTP